MGEKVWSPWPHLFDKEHTCVHIRHTDLLASRQENLETKARNEAERVFVDAAREAGILDRVGKSAAKVVTPSNDVYGWKLIRSTLFGRSFNQTRAQISIAPPTATNAPRVLRFVRITALTTRIFPVPKAIHIQLSSTIQHEQLLTLTWHEQPI
jgi:hypothetical protein